MQNDYNQRNPFFEIPICVLQLHKHYAGQCRKDTIVPFDLIVKPFNKYKC
jgi:hypothetical protein